MGDLLLSCHSFTCPVSASAASCAKVYLTFCGQGEMSDLRALIRLKEKELRCLEWSLMAQKAQEVAGAFVPESLREELEDCKAEQQVGQTPSAGTFYFSKQCKVKVNRTGGSRTLVYCGRPDSDLGAPHGKSHSYQSRIPAG